MGKSAILHTEFGQLIRDSRIKARLSQQDLATKIGAFSGQYISNIERGKILFPRNLFAPIATTLNIPVLDMALAITNDILKEYSANFKTVDPDQLNLFNEKAHE